jgi:hypothetical protein
MASGHENRANRPNTWLLRPLLACVKSVARRIASRGSGCIGWSPTGFLSHESFIHILTSASPSHTQADADFQSNGRISKSRGQALQIDCASSWIFKYNAKTIVVSGCGAGR